MSTHSELLHKAVCRRLHALTCVANPVWLQYCVASHCLSMIVAEQATEAFPPHHVPRLTTTYPYGQKTRTWLDRRSYDPAIACPSS